MDWKRGSSFIGSSLNTARSSDLFWIEAGLTPLLIGRGSTEDNFGDVDSVFNSGKKSVVGDNALSAGSSQPIQSSKVPKLKT